MNSPLLLEMERISVMRGASVVLRDFSLKIDVGEHVAILGPNGCGKSTLIKTITRECYPLARPEGRISLLGRECWNVAELRSTIGIVELDIAAHCSRPLIARDLVLSGFFGSIGTWPHQTVTKPMQDKTDSVLKRLGVYHLSDRDTRTLSSGELRRIIIGRALVHDPLALLLDEPTTSLDLGAQHELRSAMRHLASSGTGIVLVTHHLSDIIPEVDRVILMRSGQLIADGAKDEVLTERNLEQLFGVRVNLVQHEGYYHGW